MIFSISSKTEGRKKTKDAKVTGKKKRTLSDEEEKVEEKNTSTAQHKSNKKQKVTQEKEGRKAQKVIIALHQFHLCKFFCSSLFKLI